MPIVVSHQPPMSLLARAGYYIGAGEERQRREEMEQRERQQIRGIEANLLSQQLSFQQQNYRDAAGAAYNAAQQQNEMMNRQAMMERQAELQQAAAKLRQEERNDALMQRQKMQNEAANLRQKNQLDWDQHKFFTGQADDHMTMIREQLDDGLGFASDDEQRMYDQGMAEINKIRNNPTMRPLQRAQAMYELAQRLPIPTKQVQSLKEQIQQETQWIEDPNLPGRRVLVTRNRSGAFDVIYDPQMPKPVEDTSQQDAEKVKTMRMKQYMDAYKALTVKGSAPGEPDKTPTDQEVRAYLKQMEQYAAEGESPEQGQSVRRLKVDPATGQLMEK